jgi:hypothetical protein
LGCRSCLDLSATGFTDKESRHPGAGISRHRPSPLTCSLYGFVRMRLPPPISVADLTFLLPITAQVTSIAPVKNYHGIAYPRETTMMPCMLASSPTGTLGNPFVRSAPSSQGSNCIPTQSLVTIPLKGCSVSRFFGHVGLPSQPRADPHRGRHKTSGTEIFLNQTLDLSETRRKKEHPHSAQRKENFCLAPIIGHIFQAKKFSPDGNAFA